MKKKVIVVASGETERRSLPHLTANLAEEGVRVTEVRIPPRHRDLTVSVAAQLIDAAWFEYQYTDPPDKFVILVDVDGKDPTEALRPWQWGSPAATEPKGGGFRAIRLRSVAFGSVVFCRCEELEELLGERSRQCRRFKAGRNPKSPKSISSIFWGRPRTRPRNQKKSLPNLMRTL